MNQSGSSAPDLRSGRAADVTTHRGQDHSPPPEPPLQQSTVQGHPTAGVLQGRGQAAAPAAAPPPEAQPAVSASEQATTRPNDDVLKAAIAAKSAGAAPPVTAPRGPAAAAASPPPAALAFASAPPRTAAPPAQQVALPQRLATAPSTSTAPLAHPRQMTNPQQLANLEQEARLGHSGQSDQLGRRAAQSVAQGIGAGLVATPRPLAVAATQTGQAALAAARAAQSKEVPHQRPGRPQARSTRQKLFGIHPGQVITWEVAALTAAVSVPQSTAVMATGLAASGLLFASTVIRHRGRWLYQSAGIAVRYLFRRRTRTYDSSEQPVDAVLDSLSPHASISTLSVDDAELALITHAGGIAVVLELSAAGDNRFFAPLQSVPPISELVPPRDADEPAVTAQLITHTVPAPSLLNRSDAAAESYRELAGGLIPAARRTWIVLQVQYTPDDLEDEPLRIAIANAVRRIQRRLRKAGLRAHALGHEEAITEFMSFASTEQEPTTPKVKESWSTWSASSDVHTTFRILSWPELSDPAGADLLRRLEQIPTLSTTVSVAARRDRKDLDVEAAIRVVLPDRKAADSASAELVTIANKADCTMRRLNGEQVFGVAASFPLGGFLT